jgi:hypothetical protein
MHRVSSFGEVLLWYAIPWELKVRSLHMNRKKILVGSDQSHATIQPLLAFLFRAQKTYSHEIQAEAFEEKDKLLLNYGENCDIL